jgi:hypothetical protein
VDEIDWIEASGNYVRLHVGGESYLFRETMNAMEAKLDPGKFLRIHRSTLVNLDRIKEMQPWFSGEHGILLRDGTELRLSRGYRALRGAAQEPAIGHHSKKEEKPQSSRRYSSRAERPTRPGSLRNELVRAINGSPQSHESPADTLIAFGSPAAARRRRAPARRRTISCQALPRTVARAQRAP